MHEAPIPMINYVLVTITSAVLAYTTAMDINDPDNDGSATDKLPSLDDSDAKEPEKVEEPEDEEEEEEEKEPEEKEEKAEAEKEEPAEEAKPPAEDVPVAPEPEKNGPAVGGKRNARKIKKTKRNTPASKKHKQTRNKNRSK